MDDYTKPQQFRIQLFVRQGGAFLTWGSYMRLLHHDVVAPLVFPTLFFHTDIQSVLIDERVKKKKKENFMPKNLQCVNEW